MKLIECVVLVMFIGIFGSFFSSLMIPMTKTSICIKNIENKMERDRFIINAVNQICTESRNEELFERKIQLISECNRMWNLETFVITEMPEYYKAEWSCNKENTTLLVKKEK